MRAILKGCTVGPIKCSKSLVKKVVECMSAKIELTAQIFQNFIIDLAAYLILKVVIIILFCKKYDLLKVYFD